MAVTAAQIAAGTACFDGLAPDQKRALRVYGKVKALVGAGGADYSNTLTTQLLTDAVQFTKGMDSGSLSDASDWLTLRQSTNTPASVATVLAAVKCLVETDPQTLKRVEVLLDSLFAGTVNP